jgi:hypothetical protein
MDSLHAVDAHPAFVEILKQLTPDEAKILEFLPRVGLLEPLVDLAFLVPDKGRFVIHRNISTLGVDAGCSTAEPIPSCVDNLCRLGLTEVPPYTKLMDDWRYDRIRQMDMFRRSERDVPTGAKFEMFKKAFGLTSLGDAFRKACITEP